MTHRALDPLDRLILLSLTSCMERLSAMSAEVDNLSAVVTDMAATVAAAVSTIDALAAKVAALPVGDPADAAAIASMSGELAGLTQSLKDALARSAV